ncbi:hypothetical protein HAU06_29450 (plasmid) [Bacillus toyonensis]|uniref:hypothetical protein n=1 Tax=Bacillus toyonensis TaxID=155322 RepID=UPI001639D5CD|nr:hypothetical protein [Bacillus toyonensis]MBC2688165.1 hypothetical protein [Bacillus toyonensis]MBC2688173.1 hypothetical protein [Bacillus toyonensis]
MYSLKKKLLLSTWKEFVQFVAENFDFYSSQSLVELADKKKELAMLDLETLEDVINRTNAVKAYYDLSKGFSVVGAALLFIFTFIIKDYWLMIFGVDNLKDTSPIVIIINLFLAGLVFVLIFRITTNCEKRNYLLLQFEGVLKSIQKKKEEGE